MRLYFGERGGYDMRLAEALNCIFQDYENIYNEVTYISIQRVKKIVDFSDGRYLNQLKITFEDTSSCDSLNIKDKNSEYEFDCYYLIHLSDRQVDTVLKRIKEFIDKKWFEVYRKRLDKGFSVRYYKYIF